MFPVRPTTSILSHIYKAAAPQTCSASPRESACSYNPVCVWWGLDTEEEVASVAYSGAVVKGPLQNATVFLDYDGDGVLAADEPSVLTESDGSFALSGTVSGLGFVAQTDETTIDTSSGEVLDDVVLKAPAGSSVVTPTTTIMEEAGISAEEVVAVLGLPAGVDPTSFNPFAADSDPTLALAVEKVSQQVMTTVKSIASAVEGGGADAADAFSLAIESVVEVVKEKVDTVSSGEASAAEVAIDFTDTAALEEITEKVSEAIVESNLGSADAFESVSDSIVAAVSNVNSVIEEVEDITSDASKAAFAITSELNDQIKAAASADEGTAVVIEFADETAVETAQAEKEQEIIADAAAENDGSIDDGKWRFWRQHRGWRHG